MHAVTFQDLVLKDRGIGCAITDRQLVVQRVFGDAALLSGSGSPVVGQHLLELAPELVGSENDLADLLAGRISRLQIPQLNRYSGGPSAEYCTLVELPLRDAAGDIAGLIHVIQDVTESGRLEQRVTQHRNELRLAQEALHNQNLELMAANAELRRLDEVKSAFVSIAAHELRSPLASITGYLEMLLDGEAGALSSRQSEYLRIVAGSARRLLSIARDLLDVTRIESGHIELVLRPTDLARLIRQTIAEQTPQLEVKSQRPVLRLPADLPLALCDSNRATQIIVNLLTNACQYSPECGEITVEVARSDDDPGLLAVSISDQGLGIDESDRAQLFRPFFRAGSAVRSGAPGAGLGLFIARSLAELHGGTLTLDSSSQRGSTFRVTFPIAHLT